MRRGERRHLPGCASPGLCGGAPAPAAALLLHLLPPPLAQAGVRAAAAREVLSEEGGSQHGVETAANAAALEARLRSAPERHHLTNAHENRR